MRALLFEGAERSMYNGSVKRYVDVRERFEYMAGHVDGAVNIPLSLLEMHFETATKGLDTSDTLVLYCQSGSRAAFAKHIFESHGYSNVINGINQPSIENSTKNP